MKLKLGLVFTALLVASCGTEQPLERTYVGDVNQQQASEDATGQLEETNLELSRQCLTAEDCAEVDFSVVLDHGTKTNKAGNGAVTYSGETLMGTEGISTNWKFSVEAPFRLPDNREFVYTIEGDLSGAYDFNTKEFSKDFNVDFTSDDEKAGRFAVKIKDITYCLVNNGYDRDFCLTEASDIQTRAQYINIPFMIAKEENMAMAMLCTAGDIAGSFPGEVGMIANIAKLLLKCGQN